MLLNFKKYLGTKSLCWRIPLEKATRYVGVIDLTFGMMFFAIFFLHLNEVKYKVPEDKQTLGFMLVFLPRWLSLAILTSHIIKFSMGILIYLGAVMKSPGICRFWLVVSGIGSIFAFPTNLFHLHGLLVVYQFWQELLDEARGPKGNQHRLSRGHSICPEGLDSYLPKCENNNELDGKYIGFGNTTLIQEIELTESSQRYIPVLPSQYRLTPEIQTSSNPAVFGVSTLSSSYCVGVDNLSNAKGADNHKESRQFYSDQLKVQSDTAAERKDSGTFFGITPTASPTPPVYCAVVLPTVVITTTDNQLTVVQHI